MVTASTTIVGSTATNIPIDDTIPQNTEGAEILNASITPTNASSKIKITFYSPVTDASSGATSLALFRDSGADAIAASRIASDRVAILIYEELAGTTSTRTYKVHGGTSSGTFYWNQVGPGNRNYGGVAKTELIIEEILP
jgi:hypothetical protein